MESGGLDLEHLAYELAPERIAQHPLEERDAARLLVLRRENGCIEHAQIRDLPAILPRALIVVNDTRVLSARLVGLKSTGGKAEVFLLQKLSAGAQSERWRAIGRASKGLRRGTVVSVGNGALAIRVEAVTPEAGGQTLEVALESPSAHSIATLIERWGATPLPPYIDRPADRVDRERYQTVYAREPGAVAAPTAGLHFTERLLAELEAKGHGRAAVTLHVGLGTFSPIKVLRLEDHVMHAERYAVPVETAEAIASARAQGRAVLAVGTTVVRTLESCANGRVVQPGSGETALFIRPPFPFQVVDALLTNFHLPRSTLLALVMAFGGIELVREAYRVAVERKYRFFSYGDAMLVL